MKNSIRLSLEVTPEQGDRLRELQVAFSQVCNALAPIVQQTRCWNRVTLHHLAYKTLREQFPQVGSQMVCNAIYSVSRMARALFQHPASPLNLAKLGDKPLPLMQFGETAPVYFDRHTLSLKGDQLSIYTLGGRMRFRVAADALVQARFGERKLREAVLTRRRAVHPFELTFHFAEDEQAAAAKPTAAPGYGNIPDYIQIQAAP
jgi:hypothetical protein